jgi:hypothetical protein
LRANIVVVFSSRRAAALSMVGAYP